MIYYKQCCYTVKKYGELYQMKLFALGLVILVCGYFLYGKIIEKLFGPDDREVPAKKNFDGLDFLTYPVIALIAIPLYFGLFTLCELFAHKKGERFWNRYSAWLKQRKNEH